MMNIPDRLNELLTPDPADVGCAGAWELLHVYVECAQAGHDAADRYPGVAAHLAACSSCDDDFQALAALAADKDLEPDA